MKLQTTALLAFLACCVTVTLPAAGPAATDEAAISTERPSAIAVNDLEALAGAADPVTIKLLIGGNDVCISDMGGIGDPEYDAMQPAIAYNSTNNEYLVVWAGDDNVGGLVQGEYEIFGQLLDAVTGAEIGANDFRISDMGGTGNPAFAAQIPAVAYNSTNNEYLVVWMADEMDVTGGGDDEFEIYAQRLAATGTEVGANDFRISDMGGPGDTNYAA